MKSVFFLFSLLVLFTACRPSHRELIEKADEDVLNQRSELAKYLYMQVIQKHPNHDEVRYRALKGLVEVSLAQLFEYPIAIGAMEKIVDEYENDPQFRNEIPEWRRRLSEVWRINLEKPRKAREALKPLLNRTDLSETFDEEVGRTLTALGEYSDAETALKRAWDKSIKKKECAFIRSVQMELIQNYALSKHCDLALGWTTQKLPQGCEPDRFGLALEKANCLEVSGDSMAAMKIYEEVIKSNPKNLRAQFLLDNIKRREREKRIK
ncbi:MAG: hypothetical protein JWQ35_2638 [Bacteriovoracaceae bacterium]|nr:hypothetical protein [Bacteriovoracaceae bacterium]